MKSTTKQRRIARAMVPVGTSRPDFSTMTAEELKTWSDKRYAEIKAAYDANVAAGLKLVRADGSETSGPAVWVKAGK